ncbi:MAG: dTMP kinase [Treponema sp.]|nr:dTMP kinase [Treponema sp.]
MILENFIVFEGIDGSGTSTQLKLLKQSHPEFEITAEPTSTTETGKLLRRMLGGEFKVDEKTNAYLFAADRCQHLYGEGGIVEMVTKGTVVVSDRYFFSSMAYQSASCGDELPALVNSPFPLPQILFYFVINPEISLNRVNQRNEKKEIYEKIELQKKIAALYEKVISKYEADSANNKMTVVRIDATKSIEEIQEIINSTITKIIKH